MTAIVRLNDPSDHGGKMVSASGTFTTDKIKTCLDQDQHSCPIPGHGTTPVTAAGYTLTCNGTKVLHVGDKAGCGATINKGSADTTS